jgi:alkylation response protein AidB-like acyl-CoA dehydrogenase
MNDRAAAENFGEVTMSSPAAKDVDRSEELNFKTDKQNIIRMLGARFAERAADNDDHDRFVAENFNELKAQGFVEAGVPKEFGGGGASHAELSEMLRQIAGYCGSTALAFSMHTHQVAIAAWRWRHQKAPTEALLQRVAAEKMMLLSSGGSDWLQGSGTATRVDGGYRIDARKIFASGAPAGDLLMTSAVYQDPEAGPSVLHFAVPMKSAGVKILDTWRVMGMRATGSHDVELAQVFVPESAISLKRPQGKWHPLFHIISMIAIPLIYSVYVGIAEAARETTVRHAKQKNCDAHTIDLIGGLENQVSLARLALQEMIAAAATNAPGVAITNRVMIARTLAASAALDTVEAAMEVTGGRAFYRSAGLERLFRDIQASRYHPLRENVQREFAGRVALGLDIDGVI